MPSRRVGFDYGHGEDWPESADPPPAKRPRRSASRKSDSEAAKSSPAPKPSPAASRKSSSVTPKITPTRAASARARKQVAKQEQELDEATGMTSSEEESEDEADSEDAFEPPSEVEDDIAEDGDDTESIATVDSEDLDDRPVKRKQSTGGTFKAGNKRRKSNGLLEAEFDEDVELEEGQEIAGRIYPAPKTGLVPPGQLSQNTLNFLAALQHPKYNDREWFKAHEPAFRMAEKEHRDFVDAMQIKFNEVDDQLPILPARDICHRIYRDVRFSNDKTPYKSNFALTYSRAGRKGIWAAYHLYIEPGHSLLACGVWQPEKTEMQRIRERLLQNPQPLRDAIGRPEFEAMFGKAKPHSTAGRRQNVFGHPDMLKVAPKGIDKTHKDIDLLKLRSITVVKRFTDDEVLDPHFIDKLQEVVKVMAPFVHTINDYIHPAGFGGGDESD